MANRKRGEGKLLKISPPFPDSSSPSIVHLPQVFVLQKISATLHFSCFQGEFSWVFLSFSLAFHAWMKDCYCELLKAVRVLFCHEFMFIWREKSRVCSCSEVYVKELNSAENRTHRTCMSSEFFGFNTDVFAFLWYF